MQGAASDGSAIIVKRCRRETGQVERLIYEEALPHLPLPTLTYYGFVPDEDEAFAWLCLADAGGREYGSEEREHCVLAAHWLAVLHAMALDEEIVRRLPNRQPHWYRPSESAKE